MAIETDEITGLLDKIIERYKPGGEFGKTELALLERAKTKSLASTAQGMVSAGLAGTTAGVGAGRKWEEEIGMPSRLRLEDIRVGQLTEAMGAKAGFMERAATREEQLALAKAQMELQEKLANKQISSQEYLAAMDRLSKSRGAGAGGGVGAGGISPDIPRKYVPGLGTTTDRGETGGGVYPNIPAGYVNVGTPGYPSYVQGSLSQSVVGQAAPQEGDTLFPAGGGEPRSYQMQSLAEMAQKWLME